MANWRGRHRIHHFSRASAKQRDMTTESLAQIVQQLQGIVDHLEQLERRRGQAGGFDPGPPPLTDDQRRRREIANAETLGGNLSECIEYQDDAALFAELVSRYRNDVELIEAARHGARQRGRVLRGSAHAR